MSSKEQILIYKEDIIKCINIITKLAETNLFTPRQYLSEIAPLIQKLNSAVDKEENL